MGIWGRGCSEDDDKKYQEMDRNINIFIAGAMDLQKERTEVKALVNDLNATYSSKHLHIVARSNEHFKDEQSEYNAFISEKADIVLFIIDGRIGSETEKEFINATQSLREKSRPQVLVFVHEPNDMKHTPDIGRIQGLMAAGLGIGKYYVKYEDITDLKQKVVNRIKTVINDVANSTHTEKKMIRVRDLNYIKTGLLALCVSCITLGVILYLNILASKKLIIFAGGGSVATYIQETTKNHVDISLYPNSIYMNLASGSSWALLSEEANRYMDDKEAGNKHTFISICLSADKIDSTFINEKTRHIFTKARIVEYYLGSDPLTLYVSDKLCKKWGLSASDTIITKQQLAMYLRKIMSNPSEARIFTTSKNSGTLRIYQSLFAEGDSINFDEMLDKQKSFLFYKNSSSDYINCLDDQNKLPYIILGSKSYSVTRLEDSFQKILINGEGGIAAKPMYVYFVAYKRDEHNCEIREPIIEFLKEIGADEHMSESMWNDILHGQLKASGGNKIIEIR